MMPDELRSMLHASQACSGAFLSFAHLPDRVVQDENAFATVLVLGELAGSEDAGVGEMRRRAAAFLLGCRRASGAFGFYPPAAHPAWLGETLPADADDSALISVALVHAGVWSRADLEQQVRLLARYRLDPAPPGAPWYRAGIYPTWLDAARLRNPIDVCVNVNVAVLLHEAGGDYAGIVEMLAAALEHSGKAAITPYYPHPAELGHALRRAAKAGVRGCQELLWRYEAQPWSGLAGAANTPICSGLGARVFWSCPLLQAMRRWAARRRTHARLGAKR